MLKEKTALKVEPYLFMNGRAEEAIEFYKRAIGAEEQMILRFKECPDKDAPIPPGGENKIMHASLKIGEAKVMASDGQNSGNPEFKGFALTLDAKTETDAERMFNVGEYQFLMLLLVVPAQFQQWRDSGS